MADSFKLIWLLYQPASAMSAILDRGSLLYASLAVLAVSLAVEPGAAPWVRLPFYAPAAGAGRGVCSRSAAALAALAGRLGGFDVSFRRDYSPLLTCAAMAWAAAGIPLALAGWMAPAPVFPVLAGLACVYFAVLMFFAIRTVLGAGNGAAAALVCLSWIPLVAAAFLWMPLRFLLGYGVAVLSLLRLVFPGRRVFQPGRGHAQPPELPPQSGGRGPQSARWRSAISARARSTSSAAIIPMPSSGSKTPCGSIPPKPTRISSWAGSPASRAARTMPCGISKPCCSRIPNTT